MRRAFTLAIAITVGVGITWFLRSGNEPVREQASYLTPLKKLGPPREQKENIKVSSPEGCIIKPNDSIAPLKPLRTFESSAEIRDAKLLNVYRFPKKAVEAALSGDSDSAVAVFSVIRSCYPRSLKGSVHASGHSFSPASNECPRLPREYIEDPFKLLEAAASGGSAEAQFVYATNAVGLNRTLRNINTNESVTFAAESLARAEKYGKLAATAGIIDAYTFMSRSYLTGSFGYKDFELAYAYALPVAANNPSVMQEPVDRLGAKLSAHQKSIARWKAFGCSERTPDSHAANPFG